MNFSECLYPHHETFNKITLKSPIISFFQIYYNAVDILVKYGKIMTLYQAAYNFQPQQCEHKLACTFWQLHLQVLFTTQ